MKKRNKPGYWLQDSYELSEMQVGSLSRMTFGDLKFHEHSTRDVSFSGQRMISAPSSMSSRVTSSKRLVATERIMKYPGGKPFV